MVRPQTPPETPASTKPIPVAPSSDAWAGASFQWELPPSITTSPRSSTDPSAVTVERVGSPEGTITQTARGGVSSSRSSSSVEAPRAPSLTLAATASGLRS